MKIVEIRPILLEDTDKILKWRNSEIVVNNFIDRNVLTKDIHENWLKTKIANKEVYQFIAHDVDNNMDFGSTYIKNIDILHKKAEFGIFIGEDKYIGEGFGTIITKQTIDFGFKKLELNKIYARVLSYNKPSYRMFKKMGFHEDALLREDVFINNNPCDVFIMSLLKKDWLLNNGK